ncbi:hypothetical protein SASPL_148630 [Salvia splendens]|uniref:Uncharacterized protein n=1 Tax=Salvia splendens TaxID=180675 RepID=A0A8X8W9F1_SALSN|nr:hypothetical protein SASPL_148630 [Salvia splendens]
MSFLTFITGSTKSWQPAMTVNTTTAAYWLNWRVLLCSLWVLVSMVFASLLISKHECRRSSLENAENQEKELPGFAFLMLLLMLILNVAVEGGSIFYFYTQGYAEEHLDTEHGKGKEQNQQQIVRQEAGCLAYIFQIIFQMNAGAVMLTDSVFWFILVPFLLIINMHSINAVFLLGETALNSLRFPWFRIGYFFLWTCAYVLFQWILHAMPVSGYGGLIPFLISHLPMHHCGKQESTFPFLKLSFYSKKKDSRNPSREHGPSALSTHSHTRATVVIAYSTVALMQIPCYAIFVLIMKGKHSCLKKWFPESYWYAHL